VEGGEADPVRYQSGYGYMRTAGGLLAIKPPWVTLTKYDMNTGDIRWQIPVGDLKQLADRGITGTGLGSYSGGPAVTAGGLIFISTDDKLVAYDEKTGAKLWSGQLPANSDGIPAVYQLGGRQYVVVGVSAGGGGRQQAGAAPPLQAYVAFALPARR
jgi:quinoprotein glucose dehydrogenase